MHKGGTKISKVFRSRCEQSLYSVWLLSTKVNKNETMGALGCHISDNTAVSIWNLGDPQNGQRFCKGQNYHLESSPLSQTTSANPQIVRNRRRRIRRKFHQPPANIIPLAHNPHLLFQHHPPRRRSSPSGGKSNHDARTIASKPFPEPPHNTLCCSGFFLRIFEDDACGPRGGGGGGAFMGWVEKASISYMTRSGTPGRREKIIM